VVPNFRDNSFTIYLAAGDGGFVPSFLGSTGLNPVAAAAGDLDGDGKPDLVVANVSGNSVSVLFGQ
ncbi:MAG TPA: VCBS repeat-containing protein, partial [Candidatus Manganitrophaceae bacterium]|nr:VCBS repeat-containing protein [Candidatus Manganitrophaceae bacterium]